MAFDRQRFLSNHVDLSRRYFLQLGSVGLGVVCASPLFGDDSTREESLQSALGKLETWLTSQDDFRDVSRGKPKPHSLSEDERTKVGLTRETWKLEVIGDPDHPSTLENPLSKATDNALDFQSLMKIAETKRVRFAKVMTCLNIGCPLGMGIWEGVPLREAVWLAKPQANLRRVFYYGYHNDDEKQMIRSSLSVGRVLEDAHGLPPVIMCYKLNGEWLSAERGGPVRVVVPEAYGFKSVKWLTHLVLSNIPHANDTYAEQNNDVDSDLKTFCATLFVPSETGVGEKIPITGWAQSGISGLAKVQVWIQRKNQSWPADDPHFANAPWQDAEIIGAPDSFIGELNDDSILRGTHGFDAKTGRPILWPMQLAKAHWAYLHQGLPRGEYVLRCRTIDSNGAAQPMPRPFRKSGHAAIESRTIAVT